MKIPLDLIEGIQIARLCPMSWEQMPGDDRLRHCSICNQSVHNLSSMTGAEVARFLEAHEDVCVRLYRRRDGTLMTSDCPKGATARLTAVVSWVVVAAVSVLGLFAFRGWANATGGSLRNLPSIWPMGRQEMGKPCLPKAPRRPGVANPGGKDKGN